MNSGRLSLFYGFLTNLGARFLHSQKFQRGTFKLYQHGQGDQANEVLIYEPDSKKDSVRLYIRATSSTDPADLLVVLKDYLGVSNSKEINE